MSHESIIPPALSGGSARLRALVSRGVRTTLIEAGRVVGPLGRRAMDVALSGVGLVTVSPVLAAATVAVKLSSPGPIFFRQVRVGKGGREFAIYKFRSMYIDAEKRKASLESQNESVGAVTFKIKRDPRITPVGRVLRKLSIDELPQLWNVLNGTMTILGPRPPIPTEVAKYGPRQRRRLEVTPGLTCFWQVQGRSDLTFEQQVRLDLDFIDTATLADEMRILAMTVPAVATGKGAY